MNFQFEKKTRHKKFFSALFGLAIFFVVNVVHAELAPEFETMPKGSKIVIMPVDVELFSMSAGGVLEPKADWTSAAHKHMAKALTQKISSLGTDATIMGENEADEFAEEIGLHAAVANAIALHYYGARAWRLPTKEGYLNWTLGNAMSSLKSKTNAKYGLFIWARDSYATDDRKAVMVLLAIAGISIPLGTQVAYASLIDLDTGRVVWFNHIVARRGDLREEVSATYSIESLLSDFPETK